MDSLEKLQRRKAKLAAELERQKAELKGTFLEIRQEIEPVRLLKKALGLSGSKTAAAGLSGPLGLVADLLIKDPRLAILTKWLLPLALRFFPAKKAPSKNPGVSGMPPLAASEVSPGKKLKTRFYGSLRRGISTLRGHLKKKKTEPAAPAATN